MQYLNTRWPPALLASLLFAIVFPIQAFADLKISEADAQTLGILIWKNECGGTEGGLTSWNQGEDCASLGIGHFIWYPSSTKYKRQEMFPELLKYLEEQGASLPKWLKNANGCPWKNRDEFQRNINSLQMTQLRKLLLETVSLQAIFIAKRLENALPIMLKNLPDENKTKVSRQFNRLLRTPSGMYALIDYLNFKGEGIAPNERYNQQGWGLMQVLLEMGCDEDADPVKEFAKAAKAVLERRVKNSPPDKNEKRWLKGWFKRIDTYTAY